jgi:hypothetical protein
MRYSNLGKKVFPGISSTNIDSRVPKLYHCVKTHSIEVFWLLAQPIPHLCFNLFVISEMLATHLWTVLRGKHFLL